MRLTPEPKADSECLAQHSISWVLGTSKPQGWLAQTPSQNPTLENPQKYARTGLATQWPSLQIRALE